MYTSCIVNVSVNGVAVILVGGFVNSPDYFPSRIGTYLIIFVQHRLCSWKSLLLSDVAHYSDIITPL